MPAVRYGISCWIQAAARAPRVAARPRLRSRLEADVVVIGGGLAGCTAALMFAQAGIRTIVLEAERVARQGTAGSVGLMDAGAGARFADLRERHGLRASRHLWRASHEASLAFQAFIRKLKIRCDLESVDVLDVALTDIQARQLEREHRVLTEAGIAADLLTDRKASTAAGIDALAVLRRKDAAMADPYQLAQALAALAERRKAGIFEMSPAMSITLGRSGVEVATPSGSVAAQAVLVATDKPAPGLKALHRHLREVATTAASIPDLPATLRPGVGKPGLVLREASGDDARRAWRHSPAGLLLWSNGQEPPSSKQRESAAVGRVNDLMYEFSVRFPEISGIQPKCGWLASSHRSLDGVVIAGSHRAFPRHLFSVGHGHDGIQGAFLAAQLNLRCYRGAADKGDEVFGFVR